MYIVHVHVRNARPRITCCHRTKDNVYLVHVQRLHGRKSHVWYMQQATASYIPVCTCKSTLIENVTQLAQQYQQVHSLIDHEHEDDDEVGGRREQVR